MQYLIKTLLEIMGIIWPSITSKNKKGREEQYEIYMNKRIRKEYEVKKYMREQNACERR